MTVTRATIQGHVWRRESGGVSRLVRLTDCATVGEIHSNGTGRRFAVPYGAGCWHVFKDRKEAVAHVERTAAENDRNRS